MHQVGRANGALPEVVLNDVDGWEPAVLDGYDALVISPGPGDPQVPADIGVCEGAILAAAERGIPVLGVCLGHQAIAHVLGGRVVRAPEPRHGRTSPVTHDGTGPFRGLPASVEVVRYHSLMTVDLPPVLEATAWADDGVVMGLRHRSLPVWGLQFHPESIGTQSGDRMIENFLDDARTVRGDRIRSGALRVGAGSLPGPVTDPAPRGPAGGRRPVSASGLRHRTLPLRHDAERVFTALFADEEHAVWLDGNRPGDPRARFTVMGGASGDAARTAIADVQAGTVAVRHGGRTETVRSGFFDWLDAELAASAIESPDLPFGFALGWTGWLGYELRAECGSPHTRRSGLPDAAMLLLDRALIIDHEESTVHLLAVEGADEGWIDAHAALLDRLDGVPADPATPFAAPDLVLGSRHDRAAYLGLIAEAQEQIAAGETYEVCLTNMLHADAAPGDIDPLAAYRALRAENPAPFGAFVRIGGVSVLSTSPERFLRIDADGAVESSPIKGTRPRGAAPEEDARIRDELATAEKDRAENLMIVDLVRHDLGRTAVPGSVRADELFRVETYARAHQLVSTVRSQLATSAVACVRAAFPPGSMTGAPKRRTMTIIDRLEGGARGVYSGAIGTFSLDGAVDLSVVIRTLVLHDGGLDYGVGGAIVALSDADDEYAETVVKAAPLLRLLGARFPE